MKFFSILRGKVKDKWEGADTNFTNLQKQTNGNEGSANDRTMKDRIMGPNARN
jgi:hypothetical protein